MSVDSGNGMFRLGGGDNLTFALQRVSETEEDQKAKNLQLTFTMMTIFH